MYIEDYEDGCRLITKGKRQGHIFSLNATIPEISTAMFAHGMGLVADIDIWHKRIGHVNIQRLKSMQNSGVVTGLPRFKVDGALKVCAACQFGKQSRQPHSHVMHTSQEACWTWFILMCGGQQRLRHSEDADIS